MLIRSQYNRKTQQRLKISKFPESITQQSSLQHTDINQIMARVQSTGQMPIAQHSQPLVYGDFSTGTDFQSAQNSIIAGNEAFLQIPAKTRKLFDNDPANLLRFMADPKNNAESIKLGLRLSPPTSPEVEPLIQTGEAPTNLEEPEE